MKQSPAVYFGQSPYLTTRITNFVSELTSKLNKGPNDFLFIEPYSIGDAVHTFGLLPAFRRAYCTDDQKIIMLCQERALPLSSVMPFADTCFSAPLSPHELALEYIASLSNILTPELPLICAPDMHASGRISRAASSALAAKKSIFHLRQDEPFAPPVVGESLRSEAEARLSACGVLPGRSLILFSHALSLQDPGTDFWANVVGRIAAADPERVVFTDTTGGGAPVAGTRPLTVALPEVIPAVEFAGAAVLLRSGLVDLLAHADATIVSVVPPTSHYQYIPKSTRPEDLFVAKLFPVGQVTDFAIKAIDDPSASALSDCILASLAARAVAR